MKKIKRTKLKLTDILQNNSLRQVKKWKGNTKQTELLQDKLGIMTNYHCSYCDIKDIKKGLSQGEIEHFLPKSIFPNLSELWSNLFWSCRQCNSFKSNNYYKKVGEKNIKPLKPDLENTCITEEYNFNKWFRIDFDTGELIPLKSNKEWQRAKWTIELFNLNHAERIKARKDILHTYRLLRKHGIPYNHPKMHIKNFSYSFYIESWLKIKNLKYQY